jgi:uncharacterized repeat protein (TIGR03803 family)
MQKAKTITIAALLCLPLAAGAVGAVSTTGGWTHTVLLHFVSGVDGANPAAGVTFGPSGALYGTAANGGAHGSGAVFELHPAAGGAANIRVLYSFSGGRDGAYPMAGVIVGRTGELYGTTLAGGANGHGAVFELTPPLNPGDGWTERVLYSFAGGADGGSPSAGVAADALGALYGTTISGGASGRGVVFKLVPQSGGAWTETALHSFGSGGDGQLPFGGVTIGASNVLYGTTTYGGGAGFGSVFALAPTAGSVWSERVLYSFDGKGGGGLPAAGLVIDAAGALYGTTHWGGAHASGVVFKLNPPAAPGQGWSEVVLHSFGNGFNSGDDGGAPIAGVVFDGTGGLYGTTDRGGAHGQGTVYRLTPTGAAGSGWTVSLLHSFSGGDGDGPAGGVVAAAGKLYGTTFKGGSGGAGTVFELVP